MVTSSFSTPHISSYATQRGESIPPFFSQLPTVGMQQVHRASIFEVTTPTSQVALGCDAIINPLPNIHIQVKHADCLPILIAHPSGVTAVIHAGRKSTELQITTAVLRLLIKKYSLTSHIEIWFGPAICQRCYQIDRQSDLHYNLFEENEQQVQTTLPALSFRIHCPNRCTAHENNMFYSYRVEGAGVPMNWSGITYTS